MITAYWQATLKDGVDEKDFDKWIKEEWSPKLNGEGGPKGMGGEIAKGDRGPAKGHYLGQIRFDSVEARDRYFPVEGEGLSEEGRHEIDRTGFGAAFDKFWDFADLEWYGDGFVIS
jgi:hypothetical protein